MNSAFFVDLLRPHRRQLACAGALMLLQAGSLLAIPWLLGVLSETFFSELAVPVFPIAAGLIGLFALQAITQATRSFILVSVTQSIIAKLRKRVFEHVQALPLVFHNEHQRGDLVALVTSETQRLSAFLTGPLLAAGSQILTFVGALAFMMYLDPILAVPIAFGIPIATVLSKLYGRQFRALANDLRAAYASFASAAESNLALLPAVKAFVREEEVLTDYSKRVEELRRLSVDASRRQALLAPLMLFSAASAIIVFLAISTLRLEDGTITTGEFVSFLLYAALLASPAGGLASLWGQYHSALGSLHRLNRVLLLERENLIEGETLREVTGEIEFSNITFSYVGRDPVLNCVSLKISSGETVALTGENGAGKTTLVEHLLRFNKPQRGQVLLDGKDIQGLQLGQLRQAVGLVPQRAYLFDGSVLDNILFGKPSANSAAVEMATSLAQASDFIAALPNGLQTRIGDKGVKLSGGERQRLALARALIKDPPILILDEPTAMFDPDSEAAFVASVRETLLDRTVILITHRKASLALVDRVVTLQKGKIISEKKVSHDEGAISSLTKI